MRKQLTEKQIINIIKDAFGTIEISTFWPNAIRDLSDKQLVTVVRSEYVKLRSKDCNTGFDKLGKKRLYAVAKDVFCILCQREGRTLDF